MKLKQKKCAPSLNGLMIVEHIIIFFLFRRITYITYTYGQITMAITCEFQKSSRRVINEIQDHDSTGLDVTIFMVPFLLANLTCMTKH